MGRDQGLDARGEGEEMSDEKKDLAEARAEKEAQKAFRKLDAAQALNDHEKSQKAFFENRDRLRADRLAREAAVVPMQPCEPMLSAPITKTRSSLAVIATGNCGESPS